MTSVFEEGVKVRPIGQKLGWRSLVSDAKGKDFSCGGAENSVEVTGVDGEEVDLNLCGSRSWRLAKSGKVFDNRCVTIPVLESLVGLQPVPFCGGGGSV